MTMSVMMLEALYSAMRKQAISLVMQLNHSFGFVIVLLLDGLRARHRREQNLRW